MQKSNYSPVNPFLSALFFPAPNHARSRDLLAALKAPHNHILLVPVTSSILFTSDQESGLSFAELCNHEEFLASHIIKMGGSTKTIGRARLFWTLNGRSVVIKDDLVYSNKGFKVATHARLLSDRIYYSTSDIVPYDSQFLIYFISRPLIGNVAPLFESKLLESNITKVPSSKPITAFSQLLSQFPLIARQIQEPLTSVFDEFNCSEATEPDLVTMIEEVMEKGIALFQSVDHSIVNSMAQATNLTGPEIEKMLEDYVGKHLHNKIWPRLIILRSLKDSIIRAAVKNMRNVSLSQLGIQNYWSDGGDSIERMVLSAVSDFEELGKCDNAAQEADKLVKLLRNLGIVPPSVHDDNQALPDDKQSKEKSASQSNISADVLVSLMIVVVAWSKLDHLDSHLFYMRNFSFLDVDSGEIGYALSTLEAVIFHIMNDSSKLAIVSTANELFWNAIRDGKDLGSIFDNSTEFFKEASVEVSEIESIDLVYQSRNSSGESAIMMAIQAPKRNIDNLKLLLSKRDLYPLDSIIKDQNARGTTLLSAAVQAVDREAVDAIWAVLSEHFSTDELRRYVLRKDEWQRNLGHYLFHMPELIVQFEKLVSWTDKDQNGQTPLFALCRSYDHPQYTRLVKLGIEAATRNQPGGGNLRFLDHIDYKGNTLLHIMKDIQSLEFIINICDIDLNRVNDKGLTSLMVNSKFARIAAIETLARHPNVDVERRNFRGLNAAELAKDETTRSRIEDITLFRKPPIQDGRVTSVLRAFFADDNVHFIIKSGIPPATSTISSVRRTYSDFTFLAKWLSFELPSSWIPLLSIPRNPFAVPSRPSRAVIRDVQFKLDLFLRTLLLHPTFSTHELLWEFFLVPDFSRELSSERSKHKAESRKDTLAEEFPPLENTDEALMFFNHALREMGHLESTFLDVLKTAHRKQYKRLDFAEAMLGFHGILKSVDFILPPYVEALRELANLYQVSDSCDENFVQELRAAFSNIRAVVSSLNRPSSLMDELNNQINQRNKYQASLNRASTRLPLGLLDDTRSRYAHDATVNIANTELEIARIGSEIRYSQTILASELGGFNELHDREGLRTIKEYVSERLKWEKVRLNGMRSVWGKLKQISATIGSPGTKFATLVNGNDTLIEDDDIISDTATDVLSEGAVNDSENIGTRISSEQNNEIIEDDLPPSDILVTDHSTQQRLPTSEDNANDSIKETNIIEQIETEVTPALNVSSDDSQKQEVSYVQ
ncbi:hypothetical protein V1511DRAFT_511920 [Dipodascopsis uninucleata]